MKEMEQNLCTDCLPKMAKCTKSAAAIAADPLKACGLMPEYLDCMNTANEICPAVYVAQRRQNY